MNLFLIGRAFPDKKETMESALKKIISKGCVDDFLHGNFNLFIFDKKQGGSLSIMGDRYGTIPCFYGKNNDIINVSSIFHFLLCDNSENDFDEFQSDSSIH